jgi:hypothetical protein
MEVITLESSRKNKRELLNDPQGWKEVQRSRIGGDGQKFATRVKFWLYEFVPAIMYLALNPVRAWFWAPFIYFLS